MEGLVLSGSKGRLEEMPLSHCSSQYAAFHSKEILSLREGDRDVKSGSQRKEMKRGNSSKMKL